MTLAAFLLVPGVAGAGDLKKVDRTIGKEPAYVTEQPRYCLLVFGPEATTRVWLVADGDFLYIDRNGNGDLTEPGERVRFTEWRMVGEGSIAARREAEAGDLFEGKLKHTRLTVTQERVRPKFATKERSEEVLLALAAGRDDTVISNLSLNVEIRPRPGDPIPIAGQIQQYAGADGAGYLQFADRPQDAPIIHIRGPMEMGLNGPQRLLTSGEGNLEVVIGSPGLGKGTFASVGYGGLITEGTSPVAEVVFPSPSAGSLPPARYVLPHRC
jgi:hypothetical protein